MTPPPDFATETRSPWSAELGDRERAMATACGEPDGALTRVATDLAALDPSRELAESDRVAALLRQRGEPHVRPRVIRVTGRGPSDDARVQAELSAKKTAAARCGVAFAANGERERMVAVVVDAFADLDPLPTRGRTGQWLTFTAKAHVPTANAKLVVLGSRGLPRTIPTSLDRGSGKIVGRFALDRPGGFTVQLVADIGEGPRPLLEARVFADVTPSPEDGEPAPGENAQPAADDAATLAAMTTALRRSESLRPLERDARLDALAKAHVEAMSASSTVAHDLGEGDLALRFESAGLAAAIVGENVARARSIGLAHRALHASPSHRMNLLRADFTRAGYAAIRKGDDIYVCEVFAGAMR